MRASEIAEKISDGSFNSLKEAAGLGVNCGNLMAALNNHSRGNPNDEVLRRIGENYVKAAIAELARAEYAAEIEEEALSPINAINHGIDRAIGAHE